MVNVSRRTLFVCGNVLQDWSNGILSHSVESKVQGAANAAVIGNTLLGDRTGPVVKWSPGYGSLPTFCLLLLKTYKTQNNADQDFKG